MSVRSIMRTEGCRKGNNIGLVYTKMGFRSAFLRSLKECLALVKEYNERGVMPVIDELAKGLGRGERTLIKYLKECRLDGSIVAVGDRQQDQVYRVSGMGEEEIASIGARLRKENTLRNVREFLRLIREYNDAGVMPGIEELSEGLGKPGYAILEYARVCRLDRSIDVVNDRRWGMTYRATKGASDDKAEKEG